MKTVSVRCRQFPNLSVYCSTPQPLKQKTYKIRLFTHLPPFKKNENFSLYTLQLKQITSTIPQNISLQQTEDRATKQNK